MEIAVLIRAKGYYAYGSPNTTFERFSDHNACREDWRSGTILRGPQGPHHDPIFTPFFISIGLTGSFTIGAVTITTASIASAIATTALSIGLNLLLAPKPPKPEDGKAPVTQATPYRHWVVGRTRVAGALMLWEAKGANLYAVQAIAGHRIHAVNRFYLHDDEVVLDEDGFTDYTTDPYKYNVRIHYRLGLPTETAYGFIVDGDSSTNGLGDDGIYTYAYRGDGQASLGMMAKSPKAEYFGSRFPYGPPRLSVEADGALVWDFRDSGQDPDDPDTWVWSRNSALIMCWHQCFNEFGHRRNYRKAILPVLDMWQEEADVCDEDVALAAGGTQKRYWTSGWDTAEHDPKVGTNAILSSCDGWICERGDGALLFTVGKFRESRVATITDSQITGYQIQNDVLPEDECNRLVPKFTYPATDYSTSDTDFFEDEDRQVIAGRVLVQEADYTWCHQWQQARRLGIRDWRRLQMKMKGSLDLRLAGINAVYSRWVRLSTPLGLPRHHGKLLENRRSILALTKGGFSMDFIEHPENIDAWTPSTDEGQQPPVPSAPNRADIDTPVIYSVVAKARSGNVYLRIKIVDPEAEDLTLAVRYRVADDGGSPGDWVKRGFADAEPSGGYITISTGNVPADEELDVQAAFVSAKGKYSDWSATETIVSTSNPTAPPIVTNISTTTGIPGEVTVNWRAPNSSLYAGARVYYSAVNNSTSATLNSPMEAGAANGTYSRTIPLAAGTYYAWVASVNASGVEGARTATGSFVVT